MKTEEGCNLFEAVKSLNIKDTIYTAAQALEEIKKLTLQKSLKKICPSLIQTPETPDNRDLGTAQLVRDLQSIHSDIQSSDVEQ